MISFASGFYNDWELKGLQILVLIIGYDFHLNKSKNM